MRIGVACDHGGYDLKLDIVKRLRAEGHEIVDFGADQLASGDDYPDFTIPLARAVVAKTVERGVAICGSGVGACIAINKVKGARAALITDHFSARQGVEDDDMNVICLGGRIIGVETAWELVQAFLAAHFSAAERHQRRVNKVKAVEATGL